MAAPHGATWCVATWPMVCFSWRARGPRPVDFRGPIDCEARLWGEPQARRLHLSRRCTRHDGSFSIELKPTPSPLNERLGRKAPPALVGWSEFSASRRVCGPAGTPGKPVAGRPLREAATGGLPRTPDAGRVAPRVRARRTVSHRLALAARSRHGGGRRRAAFAPAAGRPPRRTAAPAGEPRATAGAIAFGRSVARGGDGAEVATRRDRRGATRWANLLDEWRDTRAIMPAFRRFVRVSRRLAVLQC